MQLFQTNNIRIGIFGGAYKWSEDNKLLAQKIGMIVALRKLTVVTGATTGIPYFAAQSAQKNGALVVGISPAQSAEQHCNLYHKPLDGCDFIVWTGSGYTGRNYLNVRNCDIAIFISGELGTLEEFCIACYEGKIIGIASGSGGITDLIPQIVAKCQTQHGSSIVYSSDPEELIEVCIQQYLAHSKLTRQKPISS